MLASSNESADYRLRIGGEVGIRPEAVSDELLPKASLDSEIGVASPDSMSNSREFTRNTAMNPFQIWHRTIPAVPSWSTTCATC